MKLIASIFGSLAAIATATATVLGVFAQHQTTQLRHVTAQASSQASTVNAQQQKIQQQDQQIRQLRASASATPSPTASGNSSGASVSGAHYLSSANPTVDSQGVNTGQQVIGAKTYANSLIWGCGGGSNPPDEAYDVAGDSVFTAEVGIPDDAQGATDVAATVTFTNESGQQVGQPVRVSLGHPVSVSMNIKGVTQLGITCAGQDQQTGQADNDFSIALGNAAVS
jgi:hypothetical protein